MDEKFTVIVHRAYPGEHDTDSVACWCNPFLIDCEDPRTPEEVLADVEEIEERKMVQ